MLFQGRQRLSFESRCIQQLELSCAISAYPKFACSAKRSEKKINKHKRGNKIEWHWHHCKNGASTCGKNHSRELGTRWTYCLRRRPNLYDNDSFQIVGRSCPDSRHYYTKLSCYEFSQMDSAQYFSLQLFAGRWGHTSHKYQHTPGLVKACPQP